MGASGDTYMLTQEDGGDIDGECGPEVEEAAFNAACLRGTGASALKARVPLVDRRLYGPTRPGYPRRGRYAQAGSQ